MVLLLVRNRQGVPEPTTIWFTGGGCQAVWRLDRPLDVEQAEELNKALLIALQGGPGTHNADRLLRLPWTMNWLNDKKRAAGREPALAFHFEPVTFEKPPRSYPAEAFQLKLPTAKGATGANQPGNLTSSMQIDPLPLPADLSEILPSEPGWVEAIFTGNNPPDKVYESRSELVFACVLWMLVRGVEPGHVMSIILSADLGISAHVLENPSPIAYARRQVEQALSKIAIRSGGWPIRDSDGRPVRNAAKNVRYALAVLGVDAQRNTFTQVDEFRGYGLEGRDLNDIAEILASAFARDLDFAATPAAIKRELFGANLLVAQKGQNAVLLFLLVARIVLVVEIDVQEPHGGQVGLLSRAFQEFSVRQEVHVALNVISIAGCDELGRIHNGRRGEPLGDRFGVAQARHGLEVDGHVRVQPVQELDGARGVGFQIMRHE